MRLTFNDTKVVIYDTIITYFLNNFQIMYETLTM